MTSARAPGKLLFFGEYAVLEGAEAVVAAVDRVARVTIVEAEVGSFQSAQVSRTPVAWERAGDGRITWKCEAEVAVRLGLVEQLVRDLPRAGGPVAARVDTSAFFEGGCKIGLGSSAALTVAWTRAAHPELAGGALRERSLTLHRAFQGGRGSGADIAASVHGGLLGYRRVADDPVRSLAWPEGLAWRAVWTGRAADTRDFLRRLGAWQEAEPARYDRAMGRLLDAAAAAVRRLQAGDVDAILASVAQYREALANLGAQAGLAIVSPVHRALTDAATAAGLAYKPSGAGGGDFGLVFGRDPEAMERFGRDVKRRGARVMALALDTRGAWLEADPEPQGL